MQLDHFNPTIDTTYQQRYFVSDQYFDHKDGPIFFYTGNEGDVVTFINNTVRFAESFMEECHLVSS